MVITKNIRVPESFIEKYLDKLKEKLSEELGIKASYTLAFLNLEKRIDRQGGLKE